MKVLIACEYSGIVRDAFLARGHDAISCDLLPTESPGPHIQGDVLPLLKERWDLVIAFPPCNYLSHLNRVFKNDERYPLFHEKQDEAISFFASIMRANAPRLAIENPRMMKRALARLGKPKFRTQPFHFGDEFRKEIWLWLRGLPPLMSTLIHTKPKRKVRLYSVLDEYKNPDGDNRYNSKRGKNRSRFFPGLAKAMADQWG